MLVTAGLGLLAAGFSNDAFAGDVAGAAYRMNMANHVIALVGMIATVEARYAPVVKDIVQRGMVSQVRQGSESVANASGEIAAGNQDLSQRTEQQAGALARDASSVARQGGAVVASEVRSLAQRSASAAREIVGTISSASAEQSRGVQQVGQAVAVFRNAEVV